MSSLESNTYSFAVYTYAFIEFVKNADELIDELTEDSIDFS
jgi:hypothetical protein